MRAVVAPHDPGGEGGDGGHERDDQPGEAREASNGPSGSAGVMAAVAAARPSVVPGGREEAGKTEEDDSMAVSRLDVEAELSEDSLHLVGGDAPEGVREGADRLD